MADDDHDDELLGMALELTLRVEFPDDAPEEWRARLVGVDDADEVVDVLATATVYRAHLDGDWFGLLDSIDGDLAGVAEAFIDRDAIEDLDEEVAWASALLVVYYVEVKEEFRGHKLSHELVRLLSRVFAHDMIALTPATLSPDEDGNLVDDEVKRRALIRHWGEMGFVPIPAFAAMMLPLSASARAEG